MQKVIQKNIIICDYINEAICYHQKFLTIGVQSCPYISYLIQNN